MRVTSQGYNTWKVQVHFEGGSWEDVRTQLAHVKSELARQFGVPDSLLEYTRLLGRDETTDGVTVQMQIVKREIPSGKPQFRLLPITAPDGTSFSDMVLEVDLYPLDEFEQFITFQKVQSLASLSGVDMSLITWPKIHEAIKHMAESYEPVLGLQVAEGELPDFGVSSGVVYGPLSQDEDLTESAWIGTHEVKVGDVLIDISAARPGRRAGRNLLGRELEPRPGVETRLEAGEGTELTQTGNRLIAMRAGIVYYRRVALNKRTRDSRDMQPVRVIASVSHSLVFDESKRYDLDVSDALLIRGDVYSGSHIRSRGPIVVQGNIEEGSCVESRASLRIHGDVSGAMLAADQHLSLLGQVRNSKISARLTVQIGGTVVDCSVRAMDVIANQIVGGDVEALSRTTIGRVHDSASGSASIRINLHKYLEEQQLASKQTIEDLRTTLDQVVQVFGPHVVNQVEQATVSRTLLQWLHAQKSTSGVAYTSSEVHDFRAILEMIPTIRQQLAAAGMELREVSERIRQFQSGSSSEAGATAESAV